MEYSHRYRAHPTQEVAGGLEHQIDVHRQAYNYTRYEYIHVDADNIGSAYKHHDRLTDWKDKFAVFKDFTRKHSNEPSRGSIRTSRTCPSRKRTVGRWGCSSGRLHGSSRV